MDVYFSEKQEKLISRSTNFMADDKETSMLLYAGDIIIDHNDSEIIK